MSRNIKLWIFTQILTISFITNFNAAEIVRIPDNNLEACIASTLNKTGDVLTDEDLKSLHVLDCSSSSIVSLEGLEGASNLISLDLSNNQISDLSPLSEMTTLTVLKLYKNQISDVTQLSKLASVSQLLLDDNQITNISSLGKLNNLEILSINNNNVSSLSELQELTSIKNFSAINNNLTSLDGLENNSNLKSIAVQGNKISDIDALSSVSTLEQVNLSNNQIKDLSPIYGNQHLTDLRVDSNLITSIDDLDELVELEEFYASNNQIMTIDCLSNLSHLITVRLANNNISDISPLSESTSIKSLDISSNQISDISPLSELPIQSQIDATDQQVKLNEVTVESSSPILYRITKLDGSIIELSSAELELGTNQVEVVWEDLNTKDKSSFSGKLDQQVNYQKQSTLSGEKKKTINENIQYTDSQLITLFGVSNSLSEKISVDQSSIKYSKPGEYEVVFSDESNNQLLTKLVVRDVKPTISVRNSNVTSEQGKIITDYKQLFGVTAMEGIYNDITSNIDVDASKVNLSTPGLYPVKFTVVDDEGNTVELSSKIKITPSEYGKFYIRKVDADGNGVPGYEYTIYDQEGNVIEVLITDENGYAESKLLRNGSYKIVLTGTPNQKNGVSKDGFKTMLNDDNQNDSSQSKLVEKGMAEPNENSIDANDSSTQNTPAEVEVHGNDTYIKFDEQNNGINQIIFSCILEDGQVVDNIDFNLVDSKGKIVASATSDENGLLLFDIVSPGVYTLVLDDTEKHFNLKSEVNLSIDEDDISIKTPQQVILEQKNTKGVEYNYILGFCAVVAILALIRKVRKNGKKKNINN